MVDNIFSLWLKRAGYSLSAFVFSLSLAWLVLAWMDFLYPIWHDHTSISKGIDKFGAQNRFKQGFETTTPTERYRVFAEINKAVHKGGKGLSTIEYESPTSRGPQFLLHQDEVVHLKDVAKLIDTLSYLVFINLFLWAMATALMILGKARIVSLKQQSLCLGVFIGLSLLALFAIGPNAVFSQLHIWIFPDEHKWFFYYQDSLMSTLMLAPTLFGYIAGSLLLASLLIYVGLQLIVDALHKSRSSKH